MVSSDLLGVLFIFLSITSTSGSDAQTNSNLMCGPNCLYLAAKSYNIPTSLQKLTYFAETDLTHGTSLKGMLKALRQIGLQPLLIKTDWRGLNEINNPVILLLNYKSNGHYVFMEKIDPKIVRVVDAPDRKTWTQEEFMNKFSGYAIIVCRHIEDKQKFEEQFKIKSFLSFVQQIIIILTVVFSVILIALISRQWTTNKVKRLVV
ncbi:MAG: cysteine peptidase family C39 domain-containing protein [Nitrospirae bacterium]|nr:cysteine peptidase family C39 domain-containing protein [Nitrospirota bacterium]